MDDQFSLRQLFELGGVFMWPLLVFSILTVFLLVERTVYILFHDLNVHGIKVFLLTMVREKKLPEAKTYLGSLNKRKTAAPIFLALLEAAPQGEHRMEKAVEAEAGEKIRQLENGFNFLQALSSLAPLTGFLGTVSGMIGAFKSIASATEVNAQLVANGIYEALITTVFGLIIAIVAVTGYSLLSHAVDKFAGDMEKGASDIISSVSKD